MIHTLPYVSPFVQVHRPSILLLDCLGSDHRVAGMSLNDLQEVRYVGFEKPNEWLDFDVSMDPSEDGLSA